jgi:hypothetical protein
MANAEVLREVYVRTYVVTEESEYEAKVAKAREAQGAESWRMSKAENARPEECTTPVQCTATIGLNLLPIQTRRSKFNPIVSRAALNKLSLSRERGVSTVQQQLLSTIPTIAERAELSRETSYSSSTYRSSQKGQPPHASAAYAQVYVRIGCVVAAR